MISFDDDGFAFVAPDDADYDDYVEQCERGGVAPAGYKTWLRVFKRQPSADYLQAKADSHLQHRTTRVLDEFEARR